MELIFHSRWVNFAVAVGDSRKDIPELDELFVDNTGGDFEIADDGYVEAAPEEPEFGFRSTNG